MPLPQTIAASGRVGQHSDFGVLIVPRAFKDLKKWPSARTQKKLGQPVLIEIGGFPPPNIAPFPNQTIGECHRRRRLEQPDPQRVDGHQFQQAVTVTVLHAPGNKQLQRVEDPLCSAGAVLVKITRIVLQLPAIAHLHHFTDAITIKVTQLGHQIPVG